MSEGGFSPEGGVPTYKPETPDKVRTMEQPVKGDWKVSEGQGQEAKAELNWKVDNRPDWTKERSIDNPEEVLKQFNEGINNTMKTEPNFSKVNEPLKPTQDVQKDKFREFSMPESKNISKWKVKE